MFINRQVRLGIIGKQIAAEFGPDRERGPRAKKYDAQLTDY